MWAVCTCMDLETRFLALVTLVFRVFPPHAAPPHRTGTRAALPSATSQLPGAPGRGSAKSQSCTPDSAQGAQLLASAIVAATGNFFSKRLHRIRIDHRSDFSDAGATSHFRSVSAFSARHVHKAGSSAPPWRIFVTNVTDVCRSPSTAVCRLCPCLLQGLLTGVTCVTLCRTSTSSRGPMAGLRGHGATRGKESQQEGASTFGPCANGRRVARPDLAHAAPVSTSLVARADSRPVTSLDHLQWLKFLAGAPTDRANPCACARSPDPTDEPALITHRSMI
jgi:hypothetical protein